MMETLVQKIQAAQTIIIHRHVNPDPDAFGSQGGLAQLICDNLPEKQVYCVGEAEPTLEHLLIPDCVGDEIYETALVIVTDTANHERIDDQRYIKASEILKIDHHPNDDEYGTWQWVNEQASSTSQLILQFGLYMRTHYNWEITANFARLVYAGIIADTGRFMYSHVDKQLFQEVAEIIELIDLQAFYQQAYRRSLGDVQFSGYLTSQIMATDSGCAYVKISNEALEMYGVSRSKASSMVNMLANIDDMPVWVLFTEDIENNNIRCSIRSRGPVINTIAQQFGGGGHQMASGARVDNWEQADQLLAVLDAVCVTYKMQK
ncbi:MAG: DHH family phosphoesterase [Culicoidibacterales bacterium]